MMLLKFLVYAFLMSSSQLLSSNAQANSDVTIQVLIPKWTRLIKESQGVDISGIGLAEARWNISELQEMASRGEEWAYKDFKWLIYDKNGTSFDDDLKDEDLLFNMDCKFAISTSNNNVGDVHQIEMMTREPHLRTDDGWSRLVERGNIICPTGTCVNDKCTNDDVPSWDHQYLVEHDPTIAKPTV